MATCMSSRASPATQPAGSGTNGFGPSSSFVLSIDMLDAAKSWQQQQQQQPHPPPKRATFTAVKKPANAAQTAGINAQNSAVGVASTSVAVSAGAGPACGVNSSSFHLGILSSGGERICPIPCVDWREAARKAEETRMLASEVCPIPAQNWRKDAPRAETRSSTLAAAKREAQGAGSASASERENKTESSCGSTKQPLLQRGNPNAAGHHKAALSVTVEEASCEDPSTDFPAHSETESESKLVTLGEAASSSSVPPFRVGVFSAQSQLRENAPFGSASPAASPTPSACSARSSVISTFSIARRSSFTSSVSSSVSSGGSSSSGGGGGYGDFTPPISRCSTLLGSASSTIDENDEPSFAERKERDATPSYLLSSCPKSHQRRSADYHADEDGGAAFTRVSTAPSVADSSRSRPPRLVMERLRLGLPNRTSSLPLRGLDSPTASSAANSPAANDTTRTTGMAGMARTRMSGRSVPKCSSLICDPAPAGLHSPVSQNTWEHMQRPTVAAAAGVKEQGGDDLQMDGGETRGQQHWSEEEGMGEVERESPFLAESACLNWKDVEELCHRMDIAGIRIETLDIQPLDDNSQAQQGSSNLHHPAAKAHTGMTATAAAGRSGPMSVGTDMTRFGEGDSCASAASVVALKFSGMHMWYYPGDNVKPLFRDAVQW